MANDPLAHVDGWYVDPISVDHYICCYDIPVMFQPPVLTNNHVLLRFNTTFGKNYNVQFKNTLNESNWQTFQTITGDGSLRTVPPAVTTNQLRLYRLLVP